MAKVLFYGGCHAQVMTRLFRAYCGNPAHSFELLVNFKLIESGQPFPYEHAKTFDVVVFSPINRAGYGTKDLLPFLDEHKIRHISYPWLAWHGYFPNVGLGNTVAGARQWFYPKLLALAAEFTDLAAFTRAVLTSDKAMQPLRDGLPPSLTSTTRIMKAHEQDHDVDIIASEFILDNYRHTRLFMSPDHPTMPLYRHVAGQVSDRLGIPLGGDFRFTGTDPQQDVKIPILPFVYEDLDLHFRDSEYRHEVIFGMNRSFPLTEYLSHVFSQAHRWPVLRATERTVLKAIKEKSWNLPSEQKRSIKSGDILVTRGMQDAGDHLHVADVALNGETVFPSAYIYKPSWKLVA